MGIFRNVSSDQLQFFNSQGYLLIESFSSTVEVEALRKRMDQLVDGFDCCSSASIFSTKNQLKQPKQISINKVGHALHDHDPVFKKVSCSDKLSGILHSLGYKRPLIIQSMYISKQPGIGGEVVPHRDNSFLYTEPQTCTGLWLALEDATIVNGCLWAIPGSHKNLFSVQYSAERQLNNLLFPRILGKQQKQKEAHQTELRIRKKKAPRPIPTHLTS